MWYLDCMWLKVEWREAVEKNRKKGIGDYVNDYLRGLGDLTGNVAVDVPAGDGRASGVLKEQGAEVLAFDLFPEFMKAEGMASQYADMTEGCLWTLLALIF